MINLIEFLKVKVKHTQAIAREEILFKIYDVEIDFCKKENKKEKTTHQ